MSPYPLHAAAQQAITVLARLSITEKPMTEGMMAGMAGMSGLIILLGIVILVLWIILPFAVFGIKMRLDAILVELKKMNRVDR